MVPSNGKGGSELVTLSICPIEDSDILWRRISYDKIDPRTGKITKRAYILPNERPDAPDPRVSVYLARKLLGPEQVAKGPRTIQGVGRLIASEVKSIEWDGLSLFSIWHRPNEALPINHAHAEIEGVRTLGDCEILARLTELVLRPPSGSTRRFSSTPGCSLSIQASAAPVGSLQPGG